MLLSLEGLDRFMIKGSEQACALQRESAGIHQVVLSLQSEVVKPSLSSFDLLAFARLVLQHPCLDGMRLVLFVIGRLTHSPSAPGWD